MMLKDTQKHPMLWFLKGSLDARFKLYQLPVDFCVKFFTLHTIYRPMYSLADMYIYFFALNLQMEVYGV